MLPNEGAVDGFVVGREIMVKKWLVSLYTFLSIIYAGCAFLFRAVIIFELNRFNKVNKALFKYEHFEYTIYHYILVMLASLGLAVSVRYFQFSGNNLIVICALTFSSVAMLHVTTKSREYITSVWLSYRYEYEEDYKITINIICLTLIMIPLLLMVMLSTLTANVILVSVSTHCVFEYRS